MPSRFVPVRLAAAAAACAIALALAAVGPARAQSTPPGFVVEDAFPGQSFFLPTQVVFLPDGRKFVVEKEGRIWTVSAAGVKDPVPFLDLNLKVLSNDDRGLHGVALDPDFATNRWVYVLYTADPDSDGYDNNLPAFGRLERYRASLANPDVADLASRQILIGGGFADGIPEPARNMHHMVGTLRFGADRTLLIGSGDAGDADITDYGGTDPSFGPGLIDPAQDIGAFRAQTLNSMDGKLLRVDKETGLGLPSNPFWNGNGAASRSRVWLYGLRNPFRFAFRPGTGAADPALGQPGVLYIGDVGWNRSEELDVARTGGLNLGWPCFEGAGANTPYQNVAGTYHPNPNVLCGAPLNAENPVAKTGPLLSWDHADSTQSTLPGWVGNCAIGGVFCTGAAYPPAWQGLYFLADYGGNWIRALRMDGNDALVSATNFVTNGGGIVDLETDPATGDLWYIDILTSTVRRVRYVPGEPPPNVVAALAPTAGLAPLTVTATASGSNDPDGDPLTFAWTFGDGGTAVHADTTYTYTTAGSYTATVTVSDGHGGFGSKSFPVTVGQQPPPGHIVQPLAGSFFFQSQSVALQASPVDTSQTPATFRWDVDFGHNTHVHVGVATFYGPSATFLPVTPNDGQLYYFRVRLTVTQGALTGTDSVRIYPRVNLAVRALATNPAAPPARTPFTVSAKVFGTGEVGSPPVAFEVRDGATVIGGGTVPALLQGDSVTVSAQVAPLATGTHALAVVVDPANGLAELDETDDAVTAPVTTTGLLAAYGMDEGAGGTLGDASGNALTGTLAGATWAAAGRYGHALSFNGTSAYVDLGTPAPLAWTGSMTWSAWVRPETNPPDDGIIVARSNDGVGWQLKTTPDTGPRTFGIAITAPGGTVHVQRYGLTQPQLHTWYHVAGVFDAAAHQLHLYVNGVLDDGVLLGAVPGAQADPGLPATIGRRTGGFFFGGFIDELRLYDRALAADEIVADMNAPLAGGTVDVPPPAGDATPAGFAFALAGANPFRGRIALTAALPRAGHVRIAVYDVSGQRVATLADEARPAGAFAADFAPGPLASGLYFCRFETEGFTATRRLLLLR